MRLLMPDPGEWTQARIQWRGTITDKQLMAFSAGNQGFQVEWYGKERFLVMSPTGSNASALATLLCAELTTWAKQRADGRVFGADGGFRLSDGSVFAPDAAWVSTNQLQTLPRESLRGFPTVCPDFVIEVKSPSDTMGAVRRKCRRWIDEGARVALLVDSEKRHAELFLPGGTTKPVVATALAIPGLEGLTLDLNEAWDDVLGPVDTGK